MANIDSQKNQIANSIANTIKKYEKRLTNIIVKVDIQDQELINSEDKEVRKIKKRILVKINAKLIKTNEHFFFEEKIYFSPVSLD